MPSKPRRATAVAIYNATVLLVRKRREPRCSLPGGSVRKGESTVAAAARHVYEQAGLHVTNVERLFSHTGHIEEHQVCLVRVRDDHIRLGKDRQLDHAEWWNGIDQRDTMPHVRAILEHEKVGFPPRAQRSSRAIRSAPAVRREGFLHAVSEAWRVCRGRPFDIMARGLGQDFSPNESLEWTRLGSMTARRFARRASKIGAPSQEGIVPTVTFDRDGVRLAVVPITFVYTVG